MIPESSHQIAFSLPVSLAEAPGLQEQRPVVSQPALSEFLPHNIHEYIKTMLFYNHTWA